MEKLILSFSFILLIVFSSCQEGEVLNGAVYTSTTSQDTGYFLKNYSNTNGFATLNTDGAFRVKLNAILIHLRFVDSNNTYGCAFYDNDENGYLEAFAGGNIAGNTFSQNNANTTYKLPITDSLKLSCEIKDGKIKAFINDKVWGEYTIGTHANDNSSISSGKVGFGIYDSSNSAQTVGVKNFTYVPY